MKTKDIILGGSVIGLAVLLYFKFGRKKAEEKTSSSNGSGSTNGTAVLIDTTGEPVKTVVATNKDNCGDFNLYYGNQVHFFKYNNGSPTVTKSLLLPYPTMNQSQTYVKATGESVLMTPQTSPIPMQTYLSACSDKKAGKNTTPPNISGGVKPNEDVYDGTGGVKPIKTYPFSAILISDIKI